MKLAEYIWIDGTKPTPQLRSKTKVIDDNDELSLWGFDGSSTNQAEGHSSDCVLKPILSVTPDPLRAGNSTLVLCEVLNPDMTPHKSNTRHQCVELAEKYEKHESWFGLEQEYTLLMDNRPLGFPENGYPSPQGQYYCSVGAQNAFGREVIDAHYEYCLYAGR